MAAAAAVVGVPGMAAGTMGVTARTHTHTHTSREGAKQIMAYALFCWKALDGINKCNLFLRLTGGRDATENEKQVPRTILHNGRTSMRKQTNRCRHGTEGELRLFFP